jgi:hypothetical protein
VSKRVRTPKSGMLPSNLLKLRSLQKKKKMKGRKTDVIKTKIINNFLSECGKHKRYVCFLNECFMQ